MYQADADRQLPAVPVSFQAAGHTNLDEVPVVLLKPSDTIISQPSRQEKRFADGRRETLDKHPGDMGGDKQVRILVIGQHTGKEFRRVEPGRWNGDPLKEIPQHGGRFPQNVVLTLHSSVDKPMHLHLVKWGERLNYGVRRRVADEGMFDVIGRHACIIGPSFFVPGLINGRYPVAFFIHGETLINRDGVTASGQNIITLLLPIF